MKGIKRTTRKAEQQRTSACEKKLRQQRLVKKKKIKMYIIISSSLCLLPFVIALTHSLSYLQENVVARKTKKERKADRKQTFICTADDLENISNSCNIFVIACRSGNYIILYNAAWSSYDKKFLKSWFTVIHRIFIFKHPHLDIGNAPVYTHFFHTALQTY